MVLASFKIVSCAVLFLVARASAFTVPVTTTAVSGGVSVWGRSATSRRDVPTSAAGVALKMASAGPAVLDQPTVKKDKKEAPVKEKKRVGSKGWAVRLFNDPMNKREFVSRCLMEIAGLSDTAAYQIMMQAHQHGVSIVGQYHQELAELYRNRLVEHGLVCDMVPVDDEDK